VSGSGERRGTLLGHQCSRPSCITVVPPPVTAVILPAHRPVSPGRLQGAGNPHHVGEASSARSPEAWRGWDGREDRAGPGHLAPASGLLSSGLRRARWAERSGIAHIAGRRARRALVTPRRGPKTARETSPSSAVRSSVQRCCFRSTGGRSRSPFRAASCRSGELAEGWHAERHASTRRVVGECGAGLLLRVRRVSCGGFSIPIVRRRADGPSRAIE
jgi:hypothetical protein